MEHKAYPQFAAHILPVLALAAIILAGCSPGETPSPAVPVATELTATSSAIAGDTPIASPLRTPTGQTTILATPQPAASFTPTSTVTPDSYTSQGDTMPGRSSSVLPTPGTPQAILAVPCIVDLDALELRSGPGPGYDLITTLAAGTALSALKYHQADDLWLLVETIHRDTGWINAGAVSCQGDLSQLLMVQEISLSPPAASLTPTASPVVTAPTPTSTPVVTAPTPTPSPGASPTLPPPSLTSWRGEYYDNPNLAGEPVLVRDDPVLDFNWGPDSPGPNIPADNFSVRWTRSFEFTEAGDFRFLADVDDGVKLYLDGWLIIDEWNTNPYVLHSGAFGDIQPGVHTIVVEFFEEAGDAHIKVWMEKTLVSADKWVGEYYNNPDFRDAPVLIREEDDLDFDWGDDEPASGMNDDFSVRWHRTVTLKEGDYDFEAKLAKRDRVRIYLDNWLVLEEDSENGGTVSSTFRDVGAGTHAIRVEYQDYSGEARIEVNLDKND